MQSPVPPPGNSTKHTRVFDSGPFLALYVNMTSSTKPEVHNVSHCHQRRTKTRSHVTRINRPFCEIWTVIRADKQTNKQTNKQTDRHCEPIHHKFHFGHLYPLQISMRAKFRTRLLEGTYGIFLYMPNFTVISIFSRPCGHKLQTLPVFEFNIRWWRHFST